MEMIKILRRKRCKKFLAALYTLSVILVISGCHEIEYPEFSAAENTTPPLIIEATPEITTTTPPAPVTVEHALSTPMMNQVSFSKTIQAESEEDNLTALDGYTGKGYIQLLMGDYRTFMVNVPESQHYKITVKVCSQTSKMKLIAGGS